MILDTIDMTVRCKAFTSEPTGSYRVRVDRGGIRVWDSVAGHYTGMHALSVSAIRRIYRLAQRQIEVGARVGNVVDDDVGLVLSIVGDTAEVGWDGGQRTPTPVSDLRRIIP